MDRTHEDTDTSLAAGEPQRKEYRPPVLTRIDVGRGTANGSDPHVSENTILDYCIDS